MKIFAINKFYFLATILFTLFAFNSASQEIVVRPVEIDDVLLNPGIGFMTFQRFNGDDLNEGGRWTEGFPIDYRKYDGILPTKTFPQPPLPTGGFTGDFLNLKKAFIAGI